MFDVMEIENFGRAMTFLTLVYVEDQKIKYEVAFIWWLQCSKIGSHSV